MKNDLKKLFILTIASLLSFLAFSQDTTSTGDSAAPAFDINDIIIYAGALYGLLMTILPALIAFFMVIPGEQPEQFLQQLLDALKKNSRKAGVLFAFAMSSLLFMGCHNQVCPSDSTTEVISQMDHEMINWMNDVVNFRESFYDSAVSNITPERFPSGPSQEGIYAFGSAILEQRNGSYIIFPPEYYQIKD